MDGQYKIVICYQTDIMEFASLQFTYNFLPEKFELDCRLLGHAINVAEYSALLQWRFEHVACPG